VQILLAHERSALGRPNDNDQTMEQVKADGRDHEYIHCGDVRRRVAQKRAPHCP
jgi:hypothetical protein